MRAGLAAVRKGSNCGGGPEGAEATDARRGGMFRAARRPRIPIMVLSLSLKIAVRYALQVLTNGPD